MKVKIIISGNSHTTEQFPKEYQGIPRVNDYIKTLNGEDELKVVKVVWSDYIEVHLWKSGAEYKKENN